MRYLILACLALYGCQTAISARGHDARFSYPSSLDAESAVTCAVAAVNNKNKTGRRFSASIVSPGKEYEVHPTSDIILAGEPAFVVVRSTGAGSTISGYLIPGMRGNPLGIEAGDCG